MFIVLFLFLSKCLFYDNSIIIVDMIVYITPMNFTYGTCWQFPFDKKRIGDMANYLIYL